MNAHADALRNTEATPATLMSSASSVHAYRWTILVPANFPFDNIKIDRSFIHDLPNRSDCIAVLRAVTSLANSLHMTTTAEGVETDAELEQGSLAGCAEGQACFRKPVHDEDVRSLIQNGRRRSALQKEEGRSAQR